MLNGSKIEEPRRNGSDVIVNKNTNSFNQMLSLQSLIQKHSGLKELCKLYFFYLNLKL